MDKRQFFLTITSVICIIITIIAFGISVAVIHDQGTGYLSSDENCPSFPNGTTFKAEKKIWDRWHWTYEFDDFDGKIEMMCPTSNRDADLYVDDKLVARSDIKSFSLISKNNIRNCHGDIIYISRTADAFDSLINLNGISVSFELRDASDQNVLAYIEGTHLFDNDFDIKDTNGNVVAHIKREIISVPWYWEFTINDPTNPGADMRVLSLLAGTKSFEKSGKKDNGDACNRYFWIIGILILVIVCLIVLGIIASLIFYFMIIIDCNQCKTQLRDNCK